MDYDANEIIFDYWSNGTMLPRYRRVTFLTTKKLVIETGTTQPLFVDGPESVHEYKLDDNLFNQLKDMICNEKRKLVEHENESMGLFSTDGTNDVFKINIDGKIHTKEIYNAFMDHPEDLEGEEKEDVISYARLFNNIFDFLEEQGIFIWEDEEEE